MKKITALLLIMTYILTSFSVLAAGTYDDVDSIISGGYIQSGKVGNIFSITDKNIKFTQNYKNIASEAVTIQSS